MAQDVGGWDVGLRKRTDIRQSPNYDYMVGQLVGVTIMLSKHAELYGDEKSKGMADKAESILQFFIEDDKSASTSS
jgi:hypothetical protein